MKKVNLIAMATILSAGILAAESTPSALHDGNIKQSATVSQEFGEGRKAGPSLLALNLPVAKSHTVDHQPTYCLPSCDKTTQKALTYWNKKQQEVKDLRAKAAQLRTEAVEWNKKVNWKRLAMAKKLFFGGIIGGILGTLLASTLFTATWPVMVPFVIGVLCVGQGRAIKFAEGFKAWKAGLRVERAQELEKEAGELQFELEG